MDNSLKVASLAVVSLSTSGILLYLLNKLWLSTYKKGLNRLSLKSLNTASWKRVGRVQEIVFYPIKSCSGISVNEVNMERMGPTIQSWRDRSFLVYDENKDVVVNLMKNSSLTQVSPNFLNENSELSSNTLVLSFPKKNNLKINLNDVIAAAKERKFNASTYSLIGFDCGDEAATWISEAIQRPACRLLFHPEQDSGRNTIIYKDQFSLANDDDNGVYGTYSSMLCNKASLQDVCDRVGREVPVGNFRPNFLIEGPAAYDEDKWSYLAIGTTVFRSAAPCSRCSITTIDCHTGEQDKKMEPYKTLSTFRVRPGCKKPDFGVYLGVDQPGKVKRGDYVYAMLN